MDRSLDTAISTVLEEQQPVTAPEIAAVLDAHPVTVKRHCLQLQEAGRIRQVTGGAYVRVEPDPNERQASD